MKIGSSQAKYIIVMSLIFLCVGLFTPLPSFIFGTAGIIGTFAGWLMLLKLEKKSDDEFIIDADFTENKPKPHKADFDERLRKLEQLKTEGLLTEQEYQSKRKEIIKDKW